MNFQDAVKIVLDLEGGGQLVSHPKDPGGLTKYGISLRANPELGAEGIRSLTEAEAIEIYRKKYWSPLRLSRMSPRLTLSLFDSAVLHGPKTAGEILQQALNRLGSDLVVDGVIGEATVKAAKSYSPSRVLTAFTRERLYFCRDLEHYNVFGFGWDQRIIWVAISS
jgi:lysozyme family protein